MLTAKGMTVDKVVGLTAGVDDYLVKPFDTAELIARVSSTLRRNQEFREVSPLTGLPGNARIRREIVDRMQGRHRLRGRLHRHRPVQERQRRVRLRPRRRVHHRAGPQPAPGGRRRRAAAGLPRPHRRRRLRLHLRPRPGAAADQAGGHRLRERPPTRSTTRRTPAAATSRCRTAAATSSAPPWSPSPSGWPQSTSTGRRFTDPREVIAVASEMKKVAKSQPGSYVAIDRRRGDTGPATDRQRVTWVDRLGWQLAGSRVRLEGNPPRAGGTR